MPKNHITNPVRNKEAKVRTFFENFMLKLAMQSKKDSENSEKEVDETKYCIGAVIFSWCFLEGFINNIINNDLKHFKTEISPKTFSKLPTIQKYVFISKIISGKTFTEGNEPYCSLLLLNKLRNKLVHYDAKIEDYESYLSPKKFEKQCKEKFNIKEMMPTGSLRRILTKECADWAIKTAVKTAIKFEKNVYGEKYHTLALENIKEALDK